MALTDQVIMPGSDYQAICDATRALTGKTRVLKSGDISTELETVTPQTETWVLNPTLNMTPQQVFPVKFTSNGTEFNVIRKIGEALIYGNSQGNTQVGFGTIADVAEWVDQAYRKIVLSSASAGSIIASWLQANGEKQAPDTATEIHHVYNGELYDLLENSTITSQAPYDAMQKMTINITIHKQEKTVSPTETLQTVTSDPRKVLSKVTVNPISANYVGSGVARKSSSDLTADGSIVNVPAGYYENAASKSVATTTQATPNITVNSSGLITASAIQSAGYVSAGIKTATQQLTIQPPTTITPSSLAQTAVPQGRYTSGAVTVAAVPTETKTVALSMASGNQVINRTSGKYMTQVTVTKPSTLTPSNIKNGVEIGGITGTYTGDDVFIKNVSTINSTTSAGIITFTTSSLARYLCVRTSSDNLYVASADIRSISSWRSVGDLYLDITHKRSTYNYTWSLFRSEEPNYDDANLTVYIIYDQL